MTRLVALVRAVNVGGIKLRNDDLLAMCRAEGFEDVRTLLASGNVVFTADLPAARVAAALEARIAEHAGRATAVFVRDAKALLRILGDNPYAGEDPAKTVAFFLDRPPPQDALERVSGRGNERIALGAEEIYVHYPDGMGRSKLRIPAAQAGTARNMNTIAKLADLAARR